MAMQRKKKGNVRPAGNVKPAKPSSAPKLKAKEHEEEASMSNNANSTSDENRASDEYLSVDPDTAEKQKQQVAGTPVPESVHAPKKKNQGSIEVKESFFSKHSAGFDPGKARNGMILDHRNYVNEDVDRDGTPVEFRFGSYRPGFIDRNKNRGYVPARVDKEGNLSPNGELVDVAGMKLLVRKKEHGDILRQRHQAQVERSTRKKKQEAQTQTQEELKSLAKKLGVSDHFIAREKTEEEVHYPKRNDSDD